MPVTTKTPILVIVCVKPEFEEAVREWRKNRHLITADRVEPKGIPNLGPLSCDDIIKKISELTTEATDKKGKKPQKYIIVSDNEETLDELIVIIHNILIPKRYELHFIGTAQEIAVKNPARVIFIPKGAK